MNESSPKAKIGEEETDALCEIEQKSEQLDREIQEVFSRHSERRIVCVDVSSPQKRIIQACKVIDSIIKQGMVKIMKNKQEEMVNEWDIEKLNQLSSSGDENRFEEGCQSVEPDVVFPDTSEANSNFDLEENRGEEEIRL